MNQKRLTRFLIYLMLLIFLVNYLAQKFFWYYSIWYFDMPMHFLGGFWEGLFFIWFFSIASFKSRQWLSDFSGWKIVYKPILFVLFVGVTWEFFEFFTNNYIGRDPFNTLDTISDVFFDLSGAAFAVLYFLKRIKRTMPVFGNAVQ